MAMKRSYKQLNWETKHHDTIFFCHKYQIILKLKIHYHITEYLNATFKASEVVCFSSPFTNQDGFFLALQQVQNQMLAWFVSGFFLCFYILICDELLRDVREESAMGLLQKFRYCLSLQIQFPLPLKSYTSLHNQKSPHFSCPAVIFG